jgi:L-ascorbate metabolism protein UlaG (beta-lactamase superfamily)
MGRDARIALVHAAAFAVAVVASVLASAPARAQAPPDAQAAPDTPRNCPGLVASDAPRLFRAAVRLAALAADQVRITYAGHATFLIESPQLVRIATDYNDYVKPPLPPDIVTMNHAHSTHYTDHPDPGIKLVLRGWRNDGKPAAHDVSLKDVHVRSVSTNIRDWNGGTERNGNSIFIFEIAGLCIAHLGHLHQTLTRAQLDEIGRIDIVMAPVDGNYTLDLDGMIEVLGALKPQTIIPMHFFSAYTLDRFLSRVHETYPVEYNETPAIVVSKTTLPAKPTVVVLPGH